MTRLKLQNVEELLDAYYLKERRARAIRLVRDRGYTDAPSWVWDILEAWDIA